MPPLGWKPTLRSTQVTADRVRRIADRVLHTKLAALAGAAVLEALDVFDATVVGLLDTVHGQG